jgi:hypothetical protein
MQMPAVLVLVVVDFCNKRKPGLRGAQGAYLEIENSESDYIELLFQTCSSSCNLHAEFPLRK